MLGAGNSGTTQHANFPAYIEPTICYGHAFQRPNPISGVPDEMNHLQTGYIAYTNDHEPPMIIKDVKDMYKLLTDHQDAR